MGGYLIAVLGVVGIAVLWVTIDLGWRKLFGGEDRRLPGCGGCGGGSCRKECSAPDTPAELPRARVVDGEPQPR